MSKKFRLLVVLMMFICALAVTGCGGDKFAGDWITIQKNMAFKFGGNYYRQIKIEKNGDNYVIKEIVSSYDLKKTQKGGTFFNPIYDGNFVWEKEKEKQYTAKPDGENRLVLDGTLSMVTVTYVEKDGTLLINNQVYTKEKSSSLDDFKKSEQKRLQEMYDNDDMGIYHKKNMRSLKFSDAENK